MKIFLRNLLLKIVAIPLRLVDILRYLPHRSSRVLLHFQTGVQHISRNLKSGMASELLGGHILLWWIELLLLLLDMVGISEILETANDFVKLNSRPLRRSEEKLARSIFGNSINYSRVRIDEYALIGPRQYRFCYVSFYVINSWGKMSRPILVHELVHVWQYQHLGISYISKALQAQYTEERYNYGGVEGLNKARNENKKWQDFNFEQQADIIADYYRISHGLSPNWGNAKVEELPIYEYFVQHMHHRKTKEEEE